jgi:hypothetical protein
MSDQAQPKKRIRKIASVCLSDKANQDGSPNLYLKINDYPGQLLFVDKETQQVYVVKTASIRKPYNDNAPAFVQQELTINLDNPKSAELLSQTKADTAASE